MMAKVYKADPGRLWWCGALLLASLCLPGGVAAQSTLERSPNLEGVWAGRPGTMQFNFLHRFQVTDPPLRKVLNSPTFLLAAGLPGNLMVGSRYATSSLLVSGRPNEWEVFTRWVPWREERGGPLDVGIQLSHNGTAGSTDGELLVGRAVGPLRLLLGGRVFSALRGDDGAAAVVAGGALRLSRHVAVAADVAEVLGNDGGETAWSGGLQLAIPYSPHFLSLHVSNVNAVTLQGASLGMPERRWGFEFTVPITWSRYLAGRPQAGTDRAAAPAAGWAAGAVVEMDNRMNYLPDTVRVAVGESVVWRNTSDIVHTVTADPTRAELPESVRLPAGAQPFDSGDMRPGEAFVQVFLEPGEYRYFCIPHERAGMIGTVIVR
jgi:plastocyanin